MRNSMKLAFYLLGEKGYSCLKAIVESDYCKLNNITVIIGTDKSVVDDFSKKIKALCETKNIKSYFRTEFQDYRGYDYVFAIGWRWLIRGVQGNKLIIFHDSILPKYRGFAPLVNAALNKDKKIGVTALFGASEYDKGGVIAQKSISVIYPIRIKDLIEKIIPCYIDLLHKVLKKLATGARIRAKDQIESDATYSIWLDSEDYFLDWNSDSDYIANKINLLGRPYEHAKSYMNEQEVIIYAAEVYKNLTLEKRHVGKVLMVEDGCPVIICGRGLIKITKMTCKAGSELIPFKSFRVRFK